MTLRQPLPRIWLVTDERMGDDLLPVVSRLPAGAGILFRHYGLSKAERRALFGAVRDAADAATVMLAGPPALAADWGADGWHGWHAGNGRHSVSVHDLAEIRRAEACGAEFLFLAPVYPTRSHPGAAALGLEQFAGLVAATELPVIALGGVTQADAPALLSRGAYGWAGIDAWLRPST